MTDDAEHVCEICGATFTERGAFELHNHERVDPAPPAGVQDFDHGADEGSPAE